MSSSYIEFDDLSALHDKLKQLPGQAERAINDVLHGEGIEIVTQETTNLLPKSDRTKNTPWYVRNKKTKHARDSKWSKSEKHNLGFVVKSKGGAANKPGSFGYLVFADEGRGRSNPWEQNFTGRSIQRATPKIIDRLHGSLDELLEL